MSDATYPTGERAWMPGDDDRSWTGLWHVVSNVRYKPGWKFSLMLSFPDQDLSVPPGRKLNLKDVQLMDKRRGEYPPLSPWTLPHDHVMLEIALSVQDSMADTGSRVRRLLAEARRTGRPDARTVLDAIQRIIDDDETTSTHFFSCVPPGVMPWDRWVVDRILDVERHETCEFFAVGDKRVFYPEHQGSLAYTLKRNG